MGQATLRAGTVGVGRLGREHARVLAGLRGVTLAGVFDKHPDRGREVARPHGADQCDSLAALIADCDVITVATPTSTHADIATRIIDAGVACFVEKPICAGVAEAEALVARAAERGVPLGVGQIERYNPAVRELLSDPLVPRFIEAHRLSRFSPRGTDVAVVYDLMIHDIDLLLHLLDEEPADVRAAGAAVISDDLDICNARLEFGRGAVANLTASRISNFGMRRFRIFAESTYVALDLQEKTMDRYRLFASDDARARSGITGTAIPFGDRGQVVTLEQRRPEAAEMLQLELADFVEAVRAGRTPPVDGRAGLRALRVAEQVHRQARRLLESHRLA